MHQERVASHATNAGLKTMEKTKIKIGVVADVVCPWCYIGKRRLERAMRMSSHRFFFDVEYFPFELNPHLPEEGVDYRTYLCQRYGTEERVQQLTNHLKEIAIREGLGLAPERQRVMPNTRNAHRVALFAREEGRQHQVVDALFDAYFTRGMNLSDIDNLVDIAVQAGLNGEKTEQLLHSNTGNVEIEMAAKELQNVGITSVPLFIIGDKSGISGAQSAEVFLEAFEHASLMMVDF